MVPAKANCWCREPEEPPGQAGPQKPTEANATNASKKKRVVAPWETRRQEECALYEKVMGERASTEKELYAFVKGARSQELMKEKERADEIRHQRTHLPARSSCRVCN